MIRVEVDPKRGEFTLHVDDEGVAVLRAAAEDVIRNGPSKVLIGDQGAMLIVRHVDFTNADPVDEQAPEQDQKRGDA